MGTAFIFLNLRSINFTMKKSILLLFILLLNIGCKSVEREDLQLLNGYWEITKVIQPDGSETDFGINTIYDYYEFDTNLKGIYKKASPQINGTFLVDEYSEEIEIIEENGNFKIKFHSEFNDREVEIIEILTNKLVIKNPEEKTYYYKKAEPINLTEDELQQTK